MKRLRILALGLSLIALSAEAGTTVENVRIWSENDRTRVVLDLAQPVAHNIFTLRGPDRLVVDLKSSRLGTSLKSMPDGAGSVRAIRSAVRANGQLRVVLDLNEAVRSRSFTAGPNNKYGDRLVIDLQRSGSPHTVKTAAEAYHPGRDVVIAIDPGHAAARRHLVGDGGRWVERVRDVLPQVEPGRRLAAVDVVMTHPEREPAGGGGEFHHLAGI
mgnify:CR=1 FL=1